MLTFLVTLITFTLLSFSFESVVRGLLGSTSSPEAIEAMTQKLGYDRPLLVQYFDWIGGILHGDFGTSLFTSQPVEQAVLSRLGVTLSIVVVSLIISVIVSVILGVTAATRGGAVDKAAQGLSLVGYVVPGLLWAIALVVLLAVRLKWLPATGYVPFGEDPFGWFRSITIPVIVLVIGGVASMTSQIRGQMIGEMRKDYVRTLRMRGLSESSIVLKHALRNAGSPALTVLSLEFIQMLGGALIIENVFALPGYGSFSFNSSLQGDIPVILGITVFSVMLVVVVNLTTDILNGFLNPKARVY